MSIRVLAPGALTTVQDRGRHGSRALGVGCAGALDPHALAVANLLVGNAGDAPALEVTLTGPRLEFTSGARIAICGAQVDARVGAVAIPGWRPIALPPGAVLSIGACRSGARAYLAVAGGVHVEPVLSSASTDLRGGFGGMGGRALAAGDLLDGGDHATIDNVSVARWWIDPSPEYERAPVASVRVLAGADATMPADGLFEREWRVGTDSDRQGLRLQGAVLQALDGAERMSEPVAPGTVQLPPDGQPIVLLADAQTLGGYPRIGHAIRADWPRLAQLRPGDRLRFAPCTRDEAAQARREQMQRLARIAIAIQARRSGPGPA
jgi:antagonist of KipI